MGACYLLVTRILVWNRMPVEQKMEARTAVEGRLGHYVELKMEKHQKPKEFIFQPLRSHLQQQQQESKEEFRDQCKPTRRRPRKRKKNVGKGRTDLNFPSLTEINTILKGVKRQAFTCGTSM